MLPQMAEFDSIRGLAGLGAHLLHHDPEGTALRAILGALVRLTQPVMVEGEALPGWWTLTGPTGQADDEFPGGHGNWRRTRHQRSPGTFGPGPAPGYRR
jgi:lantibiotic biosynthesis protein